MLNNPNLLNKLIEDSKKVSEIYKPSKYWRKKYSSSKEIEKKVSKF